MKKTKNKKKTGRSSETLFSSLKGAIWGVIISVASVLVLAIIVKQGGVANEAISVINQIVKTLSIVWRRLLRYAVQEIKKYRAEFGAAFCMCCCLMVFFLW